MRQSSQLTQLILSFYRENPRELGRLNFLAHCKVFRRLGVLQIHCSRNDVARAIIANCTLIEVPIAQLRLASKVEIVHDKNIVAVFEVNRSAVLDWTI